MCVVSFFSPSGYKIIKPKESKSMYVTYLPIESRSDVKAFIESVKPEKIFWIKYELWLITLEEIFAAKIPTYLVSARFYEGHFISKWWAGLWRNCLSRFTRVFVQEEDSKNLLLRLGLESIVSGDLRFDNVLNMVKSKNYHDDVSNWSKKENVLILGSSWPKEEEIAFAFLKTNPLVNGIIVPHDVSIQHISAIKNQLKELDISFSLWSSGDLKEGHQVLVVDVIGVLSQLYPHARLAFVGGGFSGALHNVLEPLAWNLPVVTGPKIHKNWEAKDAFDKNILIIVKQYSDLQKVWEELTVSNRPIEYIRKNSGALNVIISNL